MHSRIPPPPSLPKLRRINQFDEEDIRLVMSQSEATRSLAIDALIHENGDIVDAVIRLDYYCNGKTWLA